MHDHAERDHATRDHLDPSDPPPEFADALFDVMWALTVALPAMIVLS
jgi:hypothetical protein